MTLHAATLPLVRREGTSHIPSDAEGRRTRDRVSPRREFHAESFERTPMPSFQNNPFSYGAATGAARSQVQVDQGLRAFMLGVYNNMILGLATSALVALGVNKLAVAGGPAGAAGRLGSVYLTPFGQALYGSWLWLVVALAPLAFIFFFSFRMDRMSAAAARTTFFAFAAVMGASLSAILIRYTGGSVGQVFFLTAAAVGGVGPYGLTTPRPPAGGGAVPV